MVPDYLIQTMSIDNLHGPSQNIFVPMLLTEILKKALAIWELLSVGTASLMKQK